MAISTRFVEIHTQASKAEAYALNEIAGMGYRKALEFLVKDFCIAQNKNDAEAIKSMMLGPVIQKYVPDPHVKACAERAAWLGNDETHYVRKWGDKDISDLKTLIQLTSNFIRSVLLTEQYLKDMPSRGK